MALNIVSAPPQCGKTCNCPGLIVYLKKLRAFICFVYLPADDATCPHRQRQDRRKNAHYMSVNVFSTEVLSTLLLRVRLEMELPFYTVI